MMSITLHIGQLGGTLMHCLGQTVVLAVVNEVWSVFALHDLKLRIFLKLLQMAHAVFDAAALYECHCR